MDRNRTSNGEAQVEQRRRPWWERSWGAALMLAGAALLMGAALTVWSEASLLGG